MKCKILAALCGVAFLAACQPEAQKPVTSNAAGATAIARAQTAFVAPPRSIGDVIERLERDLAQRRPDAATMLEDIDDPGIEAEDDAAPIAAAPRAQGQQQQQRGRQQQQQPQGPLRASPGERAEAERADFAQRAAETRRAANEARREGRIDRHLNLAREALSLAKRGQPRDLFVYLELAAKAEIEFGVRPRGYALYIEAADASANFPNPRPGFSMAIEAARVLAQAGRRDDARKMIARGEGLRAQLAFRRGTAPYMAEFDARLAFARGLADLGEGKLDPAETHLREAIAYMERMVAAVRAGLDARPDWHANQLALYRQQLALLLNDQQRFVEAEIYARQALQAMLDIHGPYHVATVFRIQSLTRTLVEQGRFAEARRLSSVSMGIQREMKISAASNSYLAVHLQLAAARLWQADYAGALGEYRRMAQAIGDNRGLAERWVTTSMNYGVALLMTGDAAGARQVLDMTAKQRIERYGAENFGTATVRGFRALAVARAGDLPAALAELDEISPLLERGPTGDAASSDAGGAAANRMRRVLIEEMVALYADLVSQGRPEGAEKAFRLADVARGLSVQGAIAQMSSRAGAGDPALEEAIRREQDLAQQIQATRAILADTAGTATEQRDAALEAALRGQVTAQEAERKRLADDIARRFPDYAQLRFPRPPTTAETQAALKPDEAMLAFFVGHRASYVWAVRPGQAPRFARVAMGEAQVDTEVKALRAALDPNAATLAEIPAFDVARSYKLYAAFVEPVAASLTGARAVVAVPHGALGQLPLGVLTTKPTAARAVSGASMFAEYRDTPWLVRDYAMLQVPSAAALRALRGLRAPAAGRREFAGFGDPIFSAQIASVSAPADATLLATRGAKLVRRSAPVIETASTVQLADLPPLPDTADEVLAVAAALHADPATDVFLGARAGERGVREADLVHRRFVMFATHGLVPGDLDGLVQPALALSAPALSGGEGDGLLTMEKILRLKLDADWVVLSACNTAAGDGEGAEAISGLGRAFFYAGARALLVTSWPVETTSARALTSDVFARQAANPKLDRATALRQSMLNLIGTGPEGAGFVYAHPIFWAPFLLVGDGG